MSERVVDGRYRLRAVLGQGGMATVWSGIDIRLDRPVAVKLLDPAAVGESAVVRFLDGEARTVARLAHPNIVSVYDVGIDGGQPYLVMELVEGEDLRRRLLPGPMSVSQTVTIADQICAALAAAHAAGVVHGDIKPDNVMLTRAGAVKVCDFGIARLQLATRAETRSAVVIGTSEYMAPEQATGGAVDARTDLYALGCVVYAMLTGAPPFAGDPADVLRQQVHDTVVPITFRRADVPPDLAAAVTDLLAKNPADRPGSAAALRARLSGLLNVPANQ